MLKRKAYRAWLLVLVDLRGDRKVRAALDAAMEASVVSRAAEEWAILDTQRFRGGTLAQVQMIYRSQDAVRAVKRARALGRALVRALAAAGHEAVFSVTDGPVLMWNGMH